MSEPGSIERYRDFEVWQRGIVLVELVYTGTAEFPEREQYELRSQSGRAAGAIPSNIAEDWGYSARGQSVYSLEPTVRSSLRVETQIIIAERLSDMSEDTGDDLLPETTAESKMLLSLMRSLQS